MKQFFLFIMCLRLRSICYPQTFIVRRCYFPSAVDGKVSKCQAIFRPPRTEKEHADAIADFLVYSLIHNVTLLKCMCKAVYYTKKFSGHFTPVTIFIRPWWKEINVV